MRTSRLLSAFIALLALLPREAASQHSSLTINEFMASNALAYGDANGNYEDWIEIYNSSGSTIDLAGYYVTDDLGNSNRWRIPTGQPAKTVIPPSGFLVFFADGMPERGADHIAFKLNSEKGKIFLLGTDNATLLDSISYPEQFRDISYSRSPDGSLQWVYTADFTPGKANASGCTGFAPQPIIDQEAGFYSSIDVSVQPPASGDTVRYTLDGSDPTVTSLLYTVPVGLAQTSIFKARTHRQGSLPSQIATKAFFLSNHDLPVLALMTDPKNLYDPRTGIYVNDNDGRAWERFGELEFFEDRAIAFHIPTGLRIQGNTGPRDFGKKSFRAFFRDEYGKERLVYQLYPGSPVTSFSKLVFRSGYDDDLEPAAESGSALGTLLRDPLVTVLWQRIGGLASHSRFAILYLNNNYNGIYDIKESVEEHFICDHLGYADVDILRTRWDSLEVTYGDKVQWNELATFFQNNSFGSDDKITEAERYIDIDNFTDLQALAHATQYSSWAYGAFAFREKSSRGTWKWTIWDADRAFCDVNWNGFSSQSNPLGTYLDGLITKKLLQNQRYRIEYINRIADLLNSIFSPDSINSIIDSLTQHISSEIPAEVAKWNNTVTKWTENVNAMKNFAGQRPTIVRQQMQSYFALSGQVALTVNISGRGKIRINSITENQTSWSGTYFRGIPITVTAIPEPGYRFAGWNGSSSSVETTTIAPASDTAISALFNEAGSANAELIAPKTVRSGRYFPIVVRLRTAAGEINPVEQTPMNVLFNGAHADTVIAMKRGAGTGVVQINAGAAFDLSVQNSAVPSAHKSIGLASLPTISYSGTLPAGEIVWDNSADRLITSDITIPAGCHLTISKGTWVVISKYVNVHVTGQLTVQGTMDEPVVITPDKWREPWGGMDFSGTSATFDYCFVLNGGGDLSKGYPTNDGWHTGHQHMFFASNNSELSFNQCFFLYSPGKVIGAQDCRVTITNSVSSFVWHGGEFHRVLLRYTDSHLMNLPDDNNASYTEDIDTDGLHIDYVNPNYPTYSIIDRCYFITGKDDAIDHHNSRLKVSNCWLEEFVHEGVAASGGDTIKVFNTVALNNDQGFEAGNTDASVARGPFVFIDHCVAVGNNVGFRIGDDYTATYRDFLKVTSSIAYNNKDNIWNYLFSTHTPLAGALDISYSMTNDSDYNASPFCIVGVPLFDSLYYLLPGSPGINAAARGTNMGRTDATVAGTGTIVINEIMYNAPTVMDSKDWIELYNPQTTGQDVSGWIIKDEDDLHAFSIPAGTTIPARGLWVLCGDTGAFKQCYPGVDNYSGNIPFGFGGKDQVRLTTQAGRLVDSVAYDNNAPWPKDADGGGYTIVLVDPAQDHTLAANWSRSGQFGGSPGRGNFVTGIEGTVRLQVPMLFFLTQNYPNPFNPTTVVGYQLPVVSRVSLKVYDILGREVAILADGKKEAGYHTSNFAGSRFSSGVYILRLTATPEDGSKPYIQVRRMMLIK
jgi:hypothetical protein